MIVKRFLCVWKGKETNFSLIRTGLRGKYKNISVHSANFQPHNKHPPAKRGVFTVGINPLPTSLE